MSYMAAGGDKRMNYPAASYGVSKTARNETSFEEYDPKRFKVREWPITNDEPGK